MAEKCLESVAAGITVGAIIASGKQVLIDLCRTSQALPLYREIPVGSCAYRISHSNPNLRALPCRIVMTPATESPIARRKFAVTLAMAGRTLGESLPLLIVKAQVVVTRDLVLLSRRENKIGKNGDSSHGLRKTCLNGNLSSEAIVLNIERTTEFNTGRKGGLLSMEQTNDDSWPIGVMAGGVLA